MPRIKLLTLTLSILASSPAALAQTTAMYSPKGLESREGNTTFYLTLDRRYQGIDATNLNTILTFKSLAFRRDGFIRGGSRGTTAQVELRVGLGSMERMHADLEGNFDGKPTTVFASPSFQFPDWSARPATRPAPFDLVFPFTTPYLYLGYKPIVWDAKFRGAGNETLLCDREFRSTLGFGQSLPGSSCGNFIQKYTRLSNSGSGAPKYGMQFATQGEGAPANAMTMLSLDVVKTNLTIPGLCGTLMVAPTVSMPFGVADHSGFVPEQTFATAFDPALVSATIYSQLVAFGSSPSLSSAMRVTMPINRYIDGVDAAYGWFDPKVSTAATMLVHGGTIVARWGTN